MAQSVVKVKTYTNYRSVYVNLAVDFRDFKESVSFFIILGFKLRGFKISKQKKPIGFSFFFFFLRFEIKLRPVVFYFNLLYS